MILSLDTTAYGGSGSSPPLVKRKIYLLPLFGVLLAH